MHIQDTASIAKVLNRYRQLSSRVPPKSVFKGRFANTITIPVYIGTIGCTVDLDLVTTTSQATETNNKSKQESHIENVSRLPQEVAIRVLSNFPRDTQASLPKRYIC